MDNLPENDIDNDLIDNVVVDNDLIDNIQPRIFICFSCILLILQIISIIFFLILFLCLPLLEIYFGFYYFNIINCSKTFEHITMPIWLIIKGIFSMTNNILIILLLQMKHKELKRILFYIFYYFMNIFLLIWIIIGSIIYWKDCTNFQPYDINLFTLFTGYITFLYIIFNKADNKNLKNILPI